MKKQHIGVLFFVCLLMPSMAMADLSIVVVNSPGQSPVVPGGTSPYFLVEVREDEIPVSAGHKVTFSISPDDGNVSFGTFGTLDPTTVTGDNGRSGMTFKIGSKASGTYTATATSGTASVSRTFTIGTPRSLSVSMSSSNSSANPGDKVTFTATVTENGNPVSGQALTFGITRLRYTSPTDYEFPPVAGTASLSSTSATTDSNGQASTSLSIGSGASGIYGVSATLSDGRLGTASVTVEGSSSPPPTDPDPPPTDPDPPPTDPNPPPTDPNPDPPPEVVLIPQDQQTAPGGSTGNTDAREGSTNNTSPTPGGSTGNTGAPGSSTGNTSPTPGGSTSNTQGTPPSGTTNTPAGVTTEPVNPSDLVVSIPVISKTVLDSGESFTMSVTVENIGGGLSPETILRYYRGSAVGVSGTEVGKKSVSPIAAMGTSDVSIELTAPDTPGTYLYYACLSSVTGMSNTGNTCTPNSVELTVLMPSMAMADFDIDLSRPHYPRAISSGASITFTVTVSEDGRPVSGQTVTFTVAPDAKFTADEFASLSPTSATTDSNGQAQTTLSITGDTPAHQYRVKAELANGQSDSYSMPVGVASEGALLGLSVSSGTYNAGESVPVTFSLRKGPTNISGRTVTFSLSPDNGTASLSTTSATTDGNGEARTKVILGSNASGRYTVTATLDDGKSVSSSTGSVLRSRSSPSFILAMRIEDGAVLLNPGGSRKFTAIVQKNGYVSGQTVTFSVSPNDGTVSLSSTTGTTDNNGEASTTLITRSDSSGSYKVTATLDNGQSVSYSATIGTSSSPPPTDPNPDSPVEINPPPEVVQISQDQQTAPEGPTGNTQRTPPSTLGVSIPVISKTVLDSGESFTMSVTVENTGESLSPETTLKYYRSSAVGVSGTEVGKKSVSPIAAMGTSDVSIELTAPDIPGTYLYYACISSVTGVSNTGNTCTPNSVELTVRGESQNTSNAPSVAGMKFTAAQIDDIEAQIELLAAKNDRSPAAMQTLAYLRSLIAVARPEKTQLLANYPNPFNPETWIPYQLATAANVRLTIYDINGQVVRKLALGHQAAGIYQSRSRAAYWDGRNAFGEPVASSLYFYTLTAGDFTATRKMLIRK